MSCVFLHPRSCENCLFYIFIKDVNNGLLNSRHHGKLWGAKYLNLSFWRTCALQWYQNFMNSFSRMQTKISRCQYLIATTCSNYIFQEFRLRHEAIVKSALKGIQIPHGPLFVTDTSVWRQPDLTCCNLEAKILCLWKNQLWPELVTFLKIRSESTAFLFWK